MQKAQCIWGDESSLMKPERRMEGEMTLLEHLLRHCFFHVAKGISFRPSCLNMIFLVSSFINCGFKKKLVFSRLSLLA